MSDDVFVELRNIDKEFSGTRALRGVSVSFRRGEVHGLLGENGAGKSTLIKILTGVYTPTGGEILLEGRRVRITSPMDAHRFGFGAVYQDAELVSEFTVGQNVLLGNEPRGLTLNLRSLESRAQEILDSIGIPIRASRKSAALSAAETQMIMLATLFQRRYRLIILDEPTARLSATEVDLLFRIIKGFQAEGITIIYISHRLGEVQRICDRITILRGGMVSGILQRGEITEERVTELMVAKSRDDLETYNEGRSTDAVVLKVEGLATETLRPISFQVRAGEILGITGPVGGGAEQIEKALGGIVRHSGAVWIDGREVALRSPSVALKAGIALVPEDRRKQALFPNMSLGDNVSLPVLRALSRVGLVSSRLKTAFAESVASRLSIQPQDPHKLAKFFSGGNQQKMVIGKWITAKAKVFIFAEPTSGVDIGAIKEIYDIILKVASEGAAVILISPAIEEIMSLAETVLVINDGRLVFQAPKENCTYDQLLTLSLGGRPREAA